MTELLTDRQIYDRVIQEAVPNATRFVWIATADIKDLHVERNGHFVPFLSVLSELLDRGIAVRLLHAKEPGPAFRADFDRFPSLIEGLERILCPRVHFKSVIVDGVWAYTGSANLTGAGMGAKSPNRRNFEAGIATDDTALVAGIMEQFDGIWMGAHCEACGRRKYCADFIELRG